MNIFIYILIFIMGTFFGSFYTLAVYRIPKKQDITHTHSYCPNCNHKLGVLDLFPVFSYIFLGAKCRYCKQKIRPRYFILEILTGLCFVVFAFLLNIDVYNFSKEKIITYGFLVLYLTFIAIMSATEKENRRIEKSISIYGIVISLLYIVYLCIIGQTGMYRYVIYIVSYIIILLLEIFTLKRYAKDNYVLSILTTIVTMTIFTGEVVTVNSIIFTLLIICIYMLIYKIKTSSREYKNKIIKDNKFKTLPIGFFLGISNVIYLIFALICYKFIN